MITYAFVLEFICQDVILQYVWKDETQTHIVEFQHLSSSDWLQLLKMTESSLIDFSYQIGNLPASEKIAD